MRTRLGLRRRLSSMVPTTIPRTTNEAWSEKGDEKAKEKGRLWRLKILQTEEGQKPCC